MDASLFFNLIYQIKIGKHLPDAIYLHKDAFDALHSDLVNFLPAVAKAVGIDESHWNLIKLFKKEFKLSFLHYPNFYEESYPALKQSVNIDLTKLTHKVMSYEKSENPPILHRKETMILSDNKYFQHFVALTQEGENAGLYANARTIGFKRSWENLIKQSGYELVDGRLYRNSTFIPQKNESSIDRHKTAIVRQELSSPMKNLAKHGFLDGNYSIFDYGCGRGDDLRELEAHGLDALGWDPNYNPDSDKVASDIVNLGFVLNVIEDQDERLDALLNAWELASKLLVISVMLANESYIVQFQAYKDGVITSRNTFQKYYSQSEIKNYIEQTLQEEAIAVAPGIFYIFKDKLEEQKYLQNKYKRHHNWQHLTTPVKIDAKDKAKLLISQNQELFDNFWNTCLELGRIPANEEVSNITDIKSLIGSPKKVFNILTEIYDHSEFTLSERNKKDDLRLFFAMRLFKQRKPYSKQPIKLQRDIKCFFGNYKTAINQARDLLFAIANTHIINSLCEEAHSTLSGSLLNNKHSLILHKKHIAALPLLLRVYVNAALQLYGELGDNIDLIKIHITSGKLTLMAYDDFEKSVPFLVERIKIKMAEQEIDFFDYVDEKNRPPLLNKNLYLDTKNKNLKKQISFDQRLAKLLNYSEKNEKIISSYEFAILLKNKKVKISNYTLKKLL